MRHDVFIAGYGGQGVLLAGNLLSYAAIHENRNVSFFPAYGVEKRGGSAMCTVVFADGDTGSPVVGNPSVAIILNQLSFDKYAAKVKPGGLCIINSTLVEADAGQLPGVELVAVPMNQIALDLGDMRMVNMVACGAYAAKSGSLALDSLEDALKKALPERNHRLIPANIKAIRAGAAAATQRNT
ncbi:2-oxoacid:ferredoxin oxidoreductase subunit gamma [Geobacter sp. FeAm09]|uniref:2-oxoacid:acceptor oxidoreductase family protein n=1 Tax=Geobacter sp. FeAm09 TaxID=2597769 RepID=UPI0011EEAE0C|nr:2-oxoacid:acceptor oxidoreductase family protein [Geobacter sp. FeAm09]QEM68620.1 2-oxoacid:ferredoxin oxidoreductase subunit gamma [Geobacter sp. FeAm09]